jgi:hypothetical protein
MWLEQDTAFISRILQERLLLCKKLIETHQINIKSENYAPYINHFKKIIDHLLQELAENDTYDPILFKQLRQICKQNIHQFSGNFQHQKFTRLCQNLYRLLNAPF